MKEPGFNKLCWGLEKEEGKLERLLSSLNFMFNLIDQI